MFNLTVLEENRFWPIYRKPISEHTLAIRQNDTCIFLGVSIFLVCTMKYLFSFEINKKKKQYVLKFSV